MAKGSIIIRIDPELIIQESLYGIIMALTLIMTAQMGLFQYESRYDLIIAIVGMDFVWGAIDMIIFYRCDILALYRRQQFSRSLKKLTNTREKLEAIDEEMSNTLLDFLSPEDRRRIVEEISKCNFEETSCAVKCKKHYLLNATAAFFVSFAGVIPAVLCLWVFSDYYDALVWASVISSLALIYIGYSLTPSNSFKKKLLTGVSTAAMGILFTIFAAFFGG